MRFGLIFWCWAGGALAQQAVNVYVTAPEPRVVAGQKFVSQATAVDGNGNSLPNQAWGWSSSDDQVAVVDGTGAVTSLRPGMVQIIAVAGGVRGEVRVQVLPARIEVTPADRELAPGEQLAYRARVFNSRNEELSGVALQWSVTGADGGINNAVSIGRNGVLSAFGLGKFQVRAAVNYEVSPGQFLPQFFGYTQVDVRQRGWRLRRLAASSDTREGMLVRSTLFPVAVGADGLLAVSASLDGLSKGIVTSRNGVHEVWAGSGSPGLRPRTVLVSFDTPSVNGLGEVATTGSLGGLGNYGVSSAIVLVNRDGPHFLTLAGISDAGVDLILPQYTTPFSLNDSSQCAYLASYRDPLTRADRRGIFVVDRDNFNQLLVPGDAVLPGLTGTYSLDPDFALDNAGVLTFVVNRNGGRHVYRRVTDGTYERLAGAGDRVDGRVIVQANSVAISPGGHVAFQMRSDNFQQFLVLLRVGEAARRLPLTDLRQVFDVSASGEVLYSGNGGAGTGLYGWNGVQSRTLALVGRLAPSDDPITELISAGFGAGADVIVHVSTSRRDLLVYRATPNPAVLLETGARTVGSAGLVFDGLVPGAKQGPVYLRSIIARSGVIDAGAPATAIVALGDRLPEGGRYDGTFLQRTPDGDLLLGTTNSLQRLNADNSHSLLRFPYAMDGGTLWGPSLAAANRNGMAAVLTTSTFPSSRLLTVENGAVRLIAQVGSNDPNFRTTSPSGGVFAAIRQLWVDDSGRVIALMDVNDGPAGVFAYQQGAWRSLLVAGAKVGTETVVSVNDLRVAGNRIYARYASVGDLISIASEENNGWVRRIGRGDASPTGNNANYWGNFDAFSDGRLAVAFSSASIVGLGVQRPGEALRAVVVGDTATDDGDLFLTVDSVDVRDDGRIYFTGFTAGDRWVAYVAEPI